MRKGDVHFSPWRSKRGEVPGAYVELERCRNIATRKMSQYCDKKYVAILRQLSCRSVRRLRLCLLEVPDAYVELDACETAKTQTGSYFDRGLAQEYSYYIFPQLAVIASAVSYSASEVGVVQITCQES